MSSASKAARKAAKDVYRGYMPDGLPQNLPKQVIKPWMTIKGRPSFTMYPREVVEGFSETAEYPPLDEGGDGTPKSWKKQFRLDWYEQLKKIPTVEGKLHEICRHSYHYIAHFNNWMPKYNSLPMAQYLTRTHLIDSLPQGYTQSIEKSLDESSNETTVNPIERPVSVEDVRDLLLCQIASHRDQTLRAKVFTSKSIRDGNYDPQTSNWFLQNLISAVKNLVAIEANQELSSYQTDLSPAIRSWWYHSGFEPPNNKVFYRSRKDENGRINQIIQVDGSSAFNYRSRHSIEPILSQSDSLVTDTSLIEDCCYPLRLYGGQFKFKWPVSLPGYWQTNETSHEFPHTCFLTTDCLRLRSQKNYLVAKPLEDDSDCFKSQAILTAFSWLNGLSMYHGFTPFQELDYPFTCQVITTDGKNWMFHVYQMNTHTFHRDLGGPQKNNICWSSEKMQLFENYENGQFSGVNDKVVELLIRFLSQKTSPDYTELLNLRPYLGEDLRTDEEKEEQKTLIRRCYTGMQKNKWLADHWRVPLFEHLYFRSKENRNRITHMKPQWHPPKPEYPKIFE